MKKAIDTTFKYKLFGKVARFLEKFYNLSNRVVFKIRQSADEFRFKQYRMVFGERDDDIYIITFPRSGTTLVQMMLYQLTSSGSSDFDHLYDVSPWIRASSRNRDSVKNYPSPRIIKSHDLYKCFNKNTKGRFIFVYRNGMDVAVSNFHHIKNSQLSKIRFPEYVDGFLKPNKMNWFSHTKEWLSNKNDFPILNIKFENLLKNKDGEIRRIIEFCGFESNEEMISRALKKSSFDFMKEHEDKFGDPPADRVVYNRFIRTGITGGGKDLFSPQQEAEFQRQYNMQIGALENHVTE